MVTDKRESPTGNGKELSRDLLCRCDGGKLRRPPAVVIGKVPHRANGVAGLLRQHGVLSIGKAGNWVKEPVGLAGQMKLITTAGLGSVAACWVSASDLEITAIGALKQVSVRFWQNQSFRMPFWNDSKTIVGLSWPSDLITKGKQSWLCVGGSSIHPS